MVGTFVKRSVFIAVIAMLLCAVSAYSVHAYTISNFTGTWKSSNNTGDCLSVTVKDNTKLSVSFAHTEKFDGLEMRLVPYNKKDNIKETVISDYRAKSLKGDYSLSDVNAKFEKDKNVNKDKDNRYYLFVYGYDGNYPNGKYTKPLVRGPMVKIADGKFTLQVWSDVKTNNTKKRDDKSATSGKFKNTTLSDMKLLLFHKQNSSEKRDIKTSEATRYKTVANAKISGKKDNYEKAKKLFEYVTKNYYYDNKHKTGSYDDPYYNIGYQYNKTGNKYNAYSGKVAVRCDGYAGAYCALVRSQGIPCRLVTGKHSEPSIGKNWNNTSGEHTWCEVYVNKKWITVDPCMGGEYNQWDGTTWQKADHVNWEYFDMTDENLATTHKALQIRGDYKSMPIAKVATPKVAKYNNTTVKVTWKKVKNATGYQIQLKGTKKSSTWKTIKTVGSVSSAKVTRQLGYYRVRGYGFKNGDFGDSGARVDGSWSTSKRYKVTLNKPQTPTVKKASKSKVKISWKAVSGATYYEVYSSSYKNKGFKKIKVVSGSTRSVTVTGTKNKTRYYKIRAYTFIGNASYGDNRVNSSYSSVKSFKLK